MYPRYTIPTFLHFPSFRESFILVSAQKDTSKMNQQVEVIKAYRPRSQKQVKSTFCLKSTTPRASGQIFNYKIISHPVTSGFESSALKASNRLQGRSSNPGYGRISGGFGTNLTPFSDFT